MPKALYCNCLQLFNLERSNKVSSFGSTSVYDVAIIQGYSVRKVSEAIAARRVCPRGMFNLINNEGERYFLAVARVSDCPERLNAPDSRCCYVVFCRPLSTPTAYWSLGGWFLRRVSRQVPQMASLCSRWVHRNLPIYYAPLTRNTALRVNIADKYFWISCAQLALDSNVFPDTFYRNSD